jgi:hypothetical protein
MPENYRAFSYGQFTVVSALTVSTSEVVVQQVSEATEAVSTFAPSLEVASLVFPQDDNAKEATNPSKQMNDFFILLDFIFLLNL